MPRPEPKRNLRHLLRFYAFAVPYWRLVLLAFVAMLVYSATSWNVVVLVKPAISALEQSQGGAPAPVAVAADGPAEAEIDSFQGPLQQTEENIKKWFTGLPVVRWLKSWLYPGPDLKRIAFVLAAVIGPIMLISGFTFAYTQGLVVWTVMADLRLVLFQKLSGLSLAFFASKRTGELVSRLTNDLRQVNKALRIMFGKILLNPLKCAGFFAIAVWASWRLTLLALVALPLLVMALRRFGGSIRRHSMKALMRMADITDSITQVLNGIRVVKAFNMEQAENELFEERNQAQLRRAIKLVRNRAFADVMPEFFMLIPIAVAAVAGEYMFAQGVQLPNIAMCIISLAFMIGPVKRTVTCYNDLQESLAAFARIFELLDTESVVQEVEGAVDLDGVHEEVRFENVWFAYNDTPVLKGIDLTVPCGKMYAIVGETGAGKSTLLDLVPRFYDVTDGRILIDGQDVRRVSRESLMRQIAIVGQHPFLFNRPIAENIRYGRPNASDEEVCEAARAANIHDFIMDLPKGYETLAGEAGARLSGGQRQCVTIARAILKNAPILILDEATSSLDAESERLVQQGLDRLMEGRTTFVIAHRLSTVRHADSIVVLRHGCIVEQGTHDELLESGGEYARLCRLQFAVNE